MPTPLEPDDPPRIGRYRLLGVLGSGGMGRVLLGVGPDGRLVAIKQIHPHLVAEEDFLPRFRREVQTSAKVSGAYTAAVIDFDINAEIPWLASVFVPGVPLDKAVADYGPLTVEQIRTLAVGLSSALAAIHGVGLIHRDLKPGNVILAEDGPRVIDFGIARAAEERSELTHTGSVIGSPSFMSPEQAQSQPLTMASDIFSLGTVLVLAASGKSPFAANSMPHTLYNIVHTEPDLSELPPDVRQLVEPCLAKKPEARPTPAQILDYLGPLPPHTRPWSDAVHEAIRAQAAELSALQSDPETTQVIDGESAAVAPSPVDFEQRLQELVEQSRTESERGRRVRLLVGALIGVLVLIGGIIVGVVGFGGSDEPTSSASNPLDRLNMTKLRSIDVCSLINEPLVPSLGGWTAKPESAQWGNCAATAGGHQFVIDIKRIEGYRDNGRRFDDVPILDDVTAGSDGCGRALLPAKTDPQFGITVRVKGGQSDKLCGIADGASDELTRRISERTPMMPNIRNSIARLDPCASVDNIVVKLNIGDQVRGTPDLLHSCKWVATGTVTVVFERAKILVPPDKPIQIDLGGGNVINMDDSEFKSTTCIRQGQYRAIDNVDAEIVTVNIDNASLSQHPEFRCLAAQTILANIMVNLPQVGG
ncbi:serine/threonine-protein kinase [Nocardia arthritidis]|nr:serine/threonine-protein kinase [Nocardia arthritidis]